MTFLCCSSRLVEIDPASASVPLCVCPAAQRGNDVTRSASSLSLQPEGVHGDRAVARCVLAAVGMFFLARGGFSWQSKGILLGGGRSRLHPGWGGFTRLVDLVDSQQRENALDV